MNAQVNEMEVNQQMTQTDGAVTNSGTIWRVVISHLSAFGIGIMVGKAMKQKETEQKQRNLWIFGKKDSKKGEVEDTTTSD